MKKRAARNLRRFRRRTIRVLVDVISDRRIFCDYATTLGAGGLFIETADPLPEGNVLKVRFRLPDREQLHEIEARVAWVRRPDRPQESIRSPGMGIEFTNAAAKATLASELEELAS